MKDVHGEECGLHING